MRARDGGGRPRCGCHLEVEGDSEHESQLGGGLESQYQERKDGVFSVENLQRQDWLGLSPFYCNEQDEKDDAATEKDENERVGPGDLDAAELDGEKQGQHKGSEDERTLEVDTAELALLQLGGVICLV